MKKLPFEISDLGYFPADILSLSILTTYRDTRSLLYGFYNLFGNECYHLNGSVSYNAELNWECPTLCRKNIPRNILEYREEDFLIGFIISCIDKNFYVYITLDTSKMSCYKTNGEVFSPHPLTIYGYNEEEEKFYIADFTDGLKYNKCSVNFNEFLNANKNVIEKMEMLDRFNGTNEWILDIELVKYLKNYNLKIDTDYINYLFKLFSEGRGLNGNKYSIHSRLQPQIKDDTDLNASYYEAMISEESYGINVFYDIIEHMYNCTYNNKYYFNFRHIYLIYVYYELMVAKLVELEKSKFFTNKEIMFLIGDANLHEKKLNKAIMLSMKYTQTFNKSILEKVIEIIEEEVKSIKDINIHICKLFESKT